MKKRWRWVGSLCSKTRRGGGRNRKKIKMQNSSDGICREGEIQEARIREMKKQKCMSTYGVLLIRSRGEVSVNVLVTCWKTCFRLFGRGDIIRRPGFREWSCPCCSWSLVQIIKRNKHLCYSKPDRSFHGEIVAWLRISLLQFSDNLKLYVLCLQQRTK